MTTKFGEGIPIPDVIDPPESMTVTLCVPKNTMHLAAFFGALYQLTVWTSWQRNDTTEGKQVADVWWRYFNTWDQQINDIECEDGMATCCEDIPRRNRVNPVTGNLEQSLNGGQTWGAASGGLQDLIVEPMPPVISGVAETKCDAATNVAGQVDQWIEQVTTDFDTATTILEFATAVLVAIAAAVFAALTLGALTAAEALVIPTIMAACVAAFGAGKVVFTAYWTTEIKDKILCAAYCNIGDDGSYTAAQFSEFWNDINGDLPPSPAKMLFMGFLSSVGKEGLNAMAASGSSADADCGDCECFETCANNFDVLVNTPNYFGNVIERGDGYLIVETDVINTNGKYYQWIVTNDPDSCCYITSVETISGDANFGIAWGECGAALGALTVGVLGERCVNQLQAQGSAPFTLKYNFNDCP